VRGARAARAQAQHRVNPITYTRWGAHHIIDRVKKAAPKLDALGKESLLGRGQPTLRPSAAPTEAITYTPTRWAVYEHTRIELSWRAVSFATGSSRRIVAISRKSFAA